MQTILVERGSNGFERVTSFQLKDKAEDRKPLLRLSAADMMDFPNLVL
jgi:hypothetical protein